MSADHDDNSLSKSQLKRAMQMRQKLGESLLALSPAELAELDLPEALLTALLEAPRHRGRGGQRRQRQLIGKLMRDVDPAPLEQALARLRQAHTRQVARDHQAEAWRERLLSEGDTALSELLQTHPAMEAQRVRQWLREAQRQARENRPPAAARALFRYLRDHLEAC